MDLPDPGPGLERYRDYLHLLARMHLHPRLKAKIAPSDIVQEALLKAHEKREQYRGQTDAELAGWLRRILTTTLAEAARRFGRQQRDVGLEQSLQASMQDSSERLEMFLAADQSSPTQHLVRQERIVRLAHALAQLPEEQRTVLELRHLQGFSIEAIGKHLDRSEASVAGLLRRGLQQLRELLKED